MIKGAIAACLAIGLGLAAVVFALIERAASTKAGDSSQDGDEATNERGNKPSSPAAPAAPPHQGRLSLHAAVDKGLTPGTPNFPGGTLNCKCPTDQVIVTLTSDVSFNHLCGCTKCWKPLGARFAMVGLISRGKLQVTSGAQKLRVVDPSAVIHRHACSGCGVHLYGRIEHQEHPFYGFDFVHTELSKERGWSPPQFAAFVSSLIESGAARPNELPTIRARLKELGIEAYDCLSPQLMDIMAMHMQKSRATSTRTTVA